MIERITTDMFGPLTRGHEARYCLAAGFLRPGDVVIDAACGIAHGASVLCAHRDVSYIGVDKDVSEAVVVESSVVRLIEADLTTWRPEFEFDVAVGFETVEHLPDYSTYLEWCRQAHRFVLLSVPFVPTVGTNPFHVHDFERDELIELFLDEDWELFQYLDQPSELAGLYVFARNGVSPMSLTGVGIDRSRCVWVEARAAVAAPDVVRASRVARRRVAEEQAHRRSPVPSPRSSSLRN